MDISLLGKIEEINISELKLNPDNPRKIKKKEFEILKKSIKRFPEMMGIRPIVIDSNKIILGGNQRYEACLELGWETIPIINAKYLTEEQMKSFILLDNKSSGEWDIDIMAEKWDRELLKIIDLELPGIVNADYSEDDNKDLFDIKNKYDIKKGDLIDIGKHRLICGDSTDVNIYEKLFENNNPFIMVTDPPYGTNYDPSWRLKTGVNKPNQKLAHGIVENDNQANWKESITLFNGSVIYMWHGGLKSFETAKFLIECNFDIRSQIIWNKNTMTIGRGHYHWKHEPCWYAVKHGHSSKWKGGRKQTTIWDIDKMHPQGNTDDGKTYHSTQKPIECMARPILNHGDEKDIVYDPFLGSGTTMVAAEKNNRICYGIELVPEYCDIIINRMRKQNNDLIIKLNGVLLGE